MKKAKILCGSCLTALLSIAALTACGNNNNGADEYDKNGRLILNLKNVYFEQWTGEDNYTEILNEKFGVKIKASNYSYNSWDTQVGTAINGNNLTDTIQFNLKSYNFGSSYEKWVDIGMLKALPDDMSKWPNLNKMLGEISNIDYLKVNGKLYGIPVANDISNPSKDFSSMTYVYRRDWAKQLGKYKEGDVYTWAEFNDLLTSFKDNISTLSGTDKADVLVDEAWVSHQWQTSIKTPHTVTPKIVVVKRSMPLQAQNISKAQKLRKNLSPQRFIHQTKVTGKKKMAMLLQIIWAAKLASFMITSLSLTTSN